MLQKITARFQQGIYGFYLSEFFDNRIIVPNETTGRPQGGAMPRK